jgi:hypothetical protein
VEQVAEVLERVEHLVAVLQVVPELVVLPVVPELVVLPVVPEPVALPVLLGLELPPQVLQVLLRERSLLWALQ